ncbi:MAG: hypothetical protein C0473_02920 [Cyanobacteria bacterium DS3.002]|nr:hypothetical protein [Cyanobacteria bacterium DS3.002]MBA4049825.1 hypothetical protein [Cyanobacteria bacterium DS2.008]
MKRTVVLVLIAIFILGTESSPLRAKPSESLSARKGVFSVEDCLKKLNEIDGTEIEVEGIAHLREEDYALYPTSGDSCVPSGNVLWLNITGYNRSSFALKDRKSEVFGVDGNKVIVRGIIDSHTKGHLGCHRAGLRTVTSIKLLPPAKN